MGHELGCAAIKCALTQLDSIPCDAYLSVNATPSLLSSEEFVKILDGFPLNRIVLEVTEHEPISDYKRLKTLLNRLRSEGLRIAVDDAGAGYSSFWHVLQLKPDIIKLDTRLIAGIDKDSMKEALVAAVMDFADSTGALVVGEGIESAEELDALCKLGVHMAQGYFVGQPEPISRISRTEQIQNC